MSYTIKIGTNDCPEFLNLTEDTIAENDAMLIELASEYCEVSPQESCSEGTGSTTPFDRDIADWVRSQDFYYEILEAYEPMVCYVHVLQNMPSYKDLLLIAKNAPNISILYIEELSVHVIAMNGCGMDFSDSIAYAYAVIDKDIPKSFGQIVDKFTITDEALQTIMELGGSN